VNILKQKAEAETCSCGAVHILWQWVCCRSAYKTAGSVREKGREREREDTGMWVL